MKQKIPKHSLHAPLFLCHFFCGWWRWRLPTLEIRLGCVVALVSALQHTSNGMRRVKDAEHMQTSC